MFVCLRRTIPILAYNRFLRSVLDIVLCGNSEFVYSLTGNVFG